MKTIKNLATALSLAVATWAVPSAATAEALGDIYDFRPVNELGETIDPPSAPLQAGDTMRFAVSLISPVINGNPFRLVYTGLSYSPEMAEYLTPPSIGIYVNGKFTLAQMDRKLWVKRRSDSLTDLYFSYTVKAGDFAWPVRLADADGKMIPANGESAGASTATTYYLDFLHATFPDWKVDDSTAAGTAATREANFQLSSDERRNRAGAIRESDYDDFANCGFYVKTVDFDAYDPEGAEFWRVVHQDSGVSNSVPARLVVGSMPTESTTLYLWSEDENSFLLAKGTEQDVHVTADLTEKRHVLEIKVIAGKQIYDIDLLGKTEGTWTNLVLSAFPDFNYRKVGMTGSPRLDDYLTVPVFCCGPKPPSVSVSVGQSPIVATSDHASRLTELKVAFSQPFPADRDVTIEIKPELTDATGTHAWYDYLRFSDAVDEDVTLQAATTYNVHPKVVIEKGRTDVSKLILGDGTERAILNGVIYVYALFSDDFSNATKGQFRIGLDTDDAAAKKPSSEGGIDGWGSTCALVVKAEAPALSSTVESIPAVRKVAQPFDIAVTDVWNGLKDATGYELFYQTVEQGFDPKDDGWQAVATGAYWKPDGSGILKGADGKSPTVTYPLSGTYETYFYVKSPTGLTSAKGKAEALKFKVTVTNPDTVAAKISLDKEAWVSTGKFDESDENPLYVTIELERPVKSGEAVYAFLAPIGDAADYVRGDILTNSSYTSGIKIPENATVPELGEEGELIITDGTRTGKTIKFDIVLCKSQTYDPAQIVTGYQATTLAFVTRNVEPSFVQVKMDGAAKVTAPEETMHTGSGKNERIAYVPIGVAKKFTFDVLEPGEVDLSTTNEGERFEIAWSIVEANGATRSSEDAGESPLYGDPSKTNLVHTFSGAGTAEVTLQLKDKDMTKPGEEFVFYVEVTAQPSVLIEGPGTVDETMVTRESSPFNLSFSDFGTEPLTAKVTVAYNETAVKDRLKVGFVRLGGAINEEPYLDEDGNEYYLVVMAGGKAQLFVAESDGLAPNAQLRKGFTVTAAVVDSRTDPVSKKTYSEYYLPSSTQLYVDNVAPKLVDCNLGASIEETGSYTNTDYGLGQQISVEYKVDDILPDLTNLTGVTATWRGGSNSGSVTNILDNTNTYTYVTKFMNSGLQKISVELKDKDGNPTYRGEWWFMIESTKTLITVPNGPAGMGTTLSQRYAGQPGSGLGHVWSDATFSSADGHVISWNCSPNVMVANVYGWGYKTNAVDNGNLDSETQYQHDIPLSPKGNNTTESGRTPLTDYYKYTDAVDSFLYGWISHSTGENGGGGGGGGGGSGELTSVFKGLAPERPLNSATPYPASLPNASDNNKNAATVVYPVTYAEAVFSKELLPSDNMGDINADGIPDHYLLLADYDFGIIDPTTGELTGNDLRNLNFTEGEDPEPYCVDYLPTLDSAAYASFIPGLAETWVDAGLPFIPRLKVRGFDEDDALAIAKRGTSVSALNDAPACRYVGVRGVKPDRIYTNPREDANSTLNYVEWLAWSEYKAAHPAATEGDWSPERPTIPTRKDTDGDGLTDGYEYYIWYNAHVGYLEGGVHKYLTGRAYDPRNPGEGRLISSEDLAAAFDPNEPTAYKLRDLDNDGLPDLLEFAIGTNPFDFDSDGDGLPDGWEIMIAGTDPLSAATYADALSDTERNLDGDAMAISSYALEAAVQPVPANYEHAKRWTFAVERATGDTDGVQWYAMTAAPELEVEREIASWHRIVFLDGAERVCMSETEPVVTEDGRLAADIRAYTVVTWKPAPTEDVPEPAEELVRGYPVRIPAGTPVAVTASTESLKVYKVKTAVEAKDANACWIYGKGTVDSRYGETATASTKGYGFLALARQLAVDEGAVICAVPSEDRDVAYLHFLCYQEFGFDPRTAWKAKDPLAVRWSKAIDGESVSGITQLRQGGHTGKPTRTRDYMNYDEFLVCSFFVCNCPEGEPLNYVTYVLDEKAPEWAKAWGALTTNPQGPTDAPLVSPEHYYGRNSTNGADTDGDGVPDGWELYVMAGPKCNGAYVFAPPYDGFETAFTLPFADPATGVSKYRPGKSFWSPFVDSADTTDTSNQIYLGGEANDDLLNEYREFEGTDTMNYYADFSETVVHKDAWQWINKFFPTDPWNADTDGDGVKDGDEGKNFVYGSPADDGTRRWAAGGGLNPCSVDTDLDGLPDGWELQFKGTPGSLYKGADADYAKDADGNPVGNALQGLTDGMDGTVADAFNYPSDVNVDGAKQVVDRDYDHDGLDNWQEYMTGMMRCWRYDDPVSPLTYIPRSLYFTVDGEGNETFDAEGAAKRLNAAGILETDDVNEFWYRTLVDAKSPAYNPHFVFDTGSGAQYLSRVTNGWDVAYYDAELSNGKVSGAYYWFYDRIDGTKLVDSWGEVWTARLEADGTSLSETLYIVPGKYPSCSPIDPDSDHDGMDDRYEVFHGLNPLLGRSGEVGSWWSVNSSGSKNDSEGIDIVYDALGGGLAPQAWGTDDSEKSFRNFWQRQVADESYAGPKPRGTGFDFTVFPWLNGLATADADGDGTRNQEEAIMPLIAPTAVWHHTDPTPLWMTDSSYSNSLVRRSYRMPVRTEEIPVPENFTFDGKEYLLREFDGYKSDLSGTRLIAFNPDRWSLTGGANAMNWMFSFEENEGFDTDHDGIGDQDEVGGKYRAATDPLDADSPRRRQAMYFQGRTRPSILQTMPFVREAHPWSMAFGRYPDDMSFLQYTVECWVKADSLDDSTVIERAAWTDQSSPADKEFVRCNFRLGIRGGKWYTKYDPNDTTKNSVEVFSDVPATAEWTHLAATYDAKTLRLYVNGALHGSLDSGLQPSYGSSAVAVDGFSGVHAPPGMTYWKDREYELHAIVLGGSVKTCAQGATDGGALDVTRGIGWSGYDPDSFFEGYVDEVRVWDGARTGDEIKGAMRTRFTAAEAEANRKAFYDEWSQSGAADRYRGRYAKDGSGNAYPLPAELRFHWAFDSVFGAAGEEAVAKAPAGFNYAGEDSQGGRARLSRPDGYEITWWQKVLAGYTGTVYSDPAWVEWIPDTVAHLPRFDGTTLDSRYWSLDFAGDEVGTYSFARTAEPVSFWTQFRYGGVLDGSPAYCAESSRHYFADKYDATNGTAFATLYEFTGRHLNQTGDDLLPLGGAYVKHVDDMWDAQGSSSNWEISGTDDDGDGLPNWWEDWAEDHYRDDAVTAYGTIDWNTIVIWPDQNGLHMTAGEAYLRDLARGYHVDADGYLVDDASDGDFRQRYDLDGNGMPDWWADMYGITGESGLDDHDNDGLPNYVEYLLSEVFRFKGVSFDPTRFDSANPGVPDYFYRVGELYVGELFTDHDLVDDAWEDLYGTGFASRRVYDAAKDSDNDGWSNRSEVRYSKQVMPIVADQVSHYTSADGLTADYPIPTIALTLHYNGAKSDAVEKAPIVVQMTTERKLERAFEAVYKIAGTASETADEGRSAATGRSSKDDGTDASTAYTRSLGKWSNRHALGTLTPGYINQNSVKLEFCYDPSAETYSWTVRHYYYQDEGASSWYDEDKRGTRSEFDADKRKYGDANVRLMSRDTEYRELADVRLRTDENSKTAFWEHTSTGERFGTLDLVSGAFDIDFGVFRGQYVVSGTNANDRASLEDQTYRIAYSVNPAVGLPRRLYLGEATTGHVREGRNTIIAFADLDGSGAYTAGEPYGCVTDVDVSWKGTEASIELTEVSAVCPRMNIADGTSDREFTWGTESGYWTNHVIGVLNGGTKTRVRVIRSLVNTYAIGSINKQIDSKVTLEQLNRVVLDKYVDLTVNPLITEADFFAAGELDIDWSTLRADIPQNVWDAFKNNGLWGEIIRFDYRVVLGEGSIDLEEVNNLHKVMFSRVFDDEGGRKLNTPVPIAPGPTAESTLTVARPTFRWKLPGNTAATVCSYPAFRIVVSDKAGAAIYDSGIQRTPALNRNYEYEWNAPISVGDRTPSGKVFANNSAYSWKVSMYNCKFRTDLFSAVGDFYVNVTTNSYDCGHVDAAVKYFGPKDAASGKIVRVRAYASPDFTGTPVAGGFIDLSAAANMASLTNDAVNCRIIGLPKGSYYLQAFIDSNANGVCDEWESMGYLCRRDGSTADYLNPTAVTFADKVGFGDTAWIYIEDADTDGDNLPDAWEFAKKGNLTAEGVKSLTPSAAGELALNKTLVGSLLDEVNRDAIPTAGLAADILHTLSASRDIAALVMGVEPASLRMTSSGVEIGEHAVEGTVAISGFTVDTAAGEFVLTVSAETVAPDGAEDPTGIYLVKVGSGVTVDIYRTDAVSGGDWTLVDTVENVKVTPAGTDLRIRSAAIDAKGGFFKIAIR